MKFNNNLPVISMRKVTSKIASFAAVSIFGCKLARARPTVPLTQWKDCASDYCSACTLPYRCDTSSGCWPGSTDACCPATNYTPQIIFQNTKGYRIKSATGYNASNGNGTNNFSAVQLNFSAIDPASGLPDKSYLLGSRDGEVASATTTVTFANEILAIKLVWTNDPDWEGIVFKDTNGIY